VWRCLVLLAACRPLLLLRLETSFDAPAMMHTIVPPEPPGPPIVIQTGATRYDSISTGQIANAQATLRVTPWDLGVESEAALESAYAPVTDTAEQDRLDAAGTAVGGHE